MVKTQLYCECIASISMVSVMLLCALVSLCKYSIVIFYIDAILELKVWFTLGKFLVEEFLLLENNFCCVGSSSFDSFI